MQLALVESPAQLLNVVEWSELHGCSAELWIDILAPERPRSRRQLINVSELVADTGVRIRWHETRSNPLAAVRVLRSVTSELRKVDRLIIGDPFSGLTQLLVTLSGAREFVVVDDGSATIEFAELMGHESELVRWHRRGQASSISRRLGAAAGRRLSPAAGASVELFTAMPAKVAGMRLTSNEFGWLRARFGAPEVSPGADLIGASLVETGVVEQDRYLDAVAALIERHQVTRYFSHRREEWPKLNQIIKLGIEVVRPDLPLEIVARQGPIAERIISFPSTVVHTLPVVLSGTGVQLSVCEIDGSWLSQRASARSAGFLTEVSSLARGAHTLAAA